MNFHKINLFFRILVFTALIPLLPGTLFVGKARDYHRVAAGLRVFPSMLAADMDIAAKAIDSGNKKRLLLVLLYVDRKDIAEELARHLRKIGNIRGIGIHVEVSADPALEKYKNAKPAGIYLTQTLDADLESVLEYGRINHRIVFSPFERDIERGAHGGIIITDKILPYINIKTMNSSKIKIKPFFMTISTCFE